MYDLGNYSVKFSLLTDFVAGGTWGTIQQSSLQDSIVSVTGMGRDVHSLKLSIHHFFCGPRRRPSSKVP